MIPVRTHYENLQIAEYASPEVIKGAYRFLSQKWHPDKNPENRAEAERISRILNAAYAVLSDPARRKEYDDWIHQQREPQPKQSGHIPPPQAPESTVAAEHGFFKRAWLMLLFVASLAMLFGVFPYQVFAGNWQWSYLAALGLWLWVGYYSYTSLFYPHVLAAEQRLERERRLDAKHRAHNWALVVSTLLFCVSVIYMMAVGFDLTHSLIGAVTLGALAWGATYSAFLKFNRRGIAQQAVPADRPKTGTGRSTALGVTKIEMLVMKRILGYTLIVVAAIFYAAGLWALAQEAQFSLVGLRETFASGALASAFVATGLGALAPGAVVHYLGSRMIRRAEQSREKVK